MHFYFIDPHTAIIERIEGKPTSDQMYALLGCERFDFYQPNPNFIDGFYLDDEGLFTQELTSANMIRSAYEMYPNNYVRGRLLYMGTNYKGESISPEGTFIYDWEDDNHMGRFLFGDSDLKATCRITRMKEKGDDVTMSKYTMPLVHEGGKGYVPVTKTLEEKLEELKTQ